MVVNAATPRFTAAPNTVLSDDADAETLVGVIVKAAGTGTIGDGKVWVTPLDSVTRVRTGETGSAAI